jgi:hypothetical protein
MAVSSEQILDFLAEVNKDLPEVVDFVNELESNTALNAKLIAAFPLLKTAEDALPIIQSRIGFFQRFAAAILKFWPAS